MEQEDNRVIIEQMEDDLYHLYDVDGCSVENDFDTYEEAEEWAKDNDYVVVHAFYI